MRLPCKLSPHCLFVGLLVGLMLAGSAVAQSPRTVVHIYKYSRVSDTDALAQQRFDEFKEILQAKILSLAEELSGQDETLKYLGALSPHFVTKNGRSVSFQGSPDQLLQRWRQSNALEIFLGRLRRDNDQFSVRSKVFLGELPNDLLSASLQVDLPIQDEQFDTTRDSHSAIILYGLAMDARQRCRPLPEVFALLSTANELLADLPEEVTGTQELKGAIVKGLANRSPCKGSTP